jgi:hypothetical protein
MSLSSRSASLGFAERTRKNLLHIQNAFASGNDVHVITQAINSLLGIVVFPWERHAAASIKDIPLSELAKDHWPQWDVVEGKCSTLGELIRFIRNGTAHAGIEFSSDSRAPDEVVLRFSNFPSRSATRPNFVASIRADQLIEFCCRWTLLIQRYLD